MLKRRIILNFYIGVEFLILTIILALIFTILQGVEYTESLISISDSVYGSTFFMMTGFHGLHVIVGSVFLIVCLIRLLLNFFYFKESVGLDCSIWYWHFVDVVWLFLFVSLYLWGNDISNSFLIFETNQNVFSLNLMSFNENNMNFREAVVSARDFFSSKIDTQEKSVKNYVDYQEKLTSYNKSDLDRFTYHWPTAHKSSISSESRIENFYEFQRSDDYKKIAEKPHYVQLVFTGVGKGEGVVDYSYYSDVDKKAEARHFDKVFGTEKSSFYDNYGYFTWLTGGVVAVTGVVAGLGVFLGVIDHVGTIKGLYNLCIWFLEVGYVKNDYMAVYTNTTVSKDIQILRLRENVMYELYDVLQLSFCNHFYRNWHTVATELTGPLIEQIIETTSYVFASSAHDRFREIGFEVMTKDEFGWLCGIQRTFRDLIGDVYRQICTRVMHDLCFEIRDKILQPSSLKWYFHSAFQKSIFFTGIICWFFEFIDPELCRRHPERVLLFSFFVAVFGAGFIDVIPGEHILSMYTGCPLSSTHFYNFWVDQVNATVTASLSRIVTKCILFDYIYYAHIFSEHLHPAIRASFVKMIYSEPDVYEYVVETGRDPLRLILPDTIDATLISVCGAEFVSNLSKTIVRVLNEEPRILTSIFIGEFMRLAGIDIGRNFTIGSLVNDHFIRESVFFPIFKSVREELKNILKYENPTIWYFGNCDVSHMYQYGFQDPATPIMEGIVDLHHKIMIYLILIFIAVIWIMYKCFSDYVKEHLVMVEFYDTYLVRFNFFKSKKESLNNLNKKIDEV